MVHARSNTTHWSWATFDNNHARIHQQRIEPKYVIAVWSRNSQKKRKCLSNAWGGEQKNNIECCWVVVDSVYMFFFLSLKFVVVWNGSDNRSERSNNMLELPVSPTDNNLRIEMAERKKKNETEKIHIDGVDVPCAHRQCRLFFICQSTKSLFDKNRLCLIALRQWRRWHREWYCGASVGGPTKRRIIKKQ